MHNFGYGELFFVAQFIKGLKEEIQSAVQMQLPDKVTKAILLAKIQQKILDKGKFKALRPTSQYKYQTGGTKTDGKSQTSSSPLWRERQERDYRKAHGLCYYCAEKYEPGHAEKSSKRPKSQMNAIVVNDLDVNLTEEVLAQLAMEDSLNVEFGQLSLHYVSCRPCCLHQT